jgi:hypothetical protein
LRRLPFVVAFLAVLLLAASALAELAQKGDLFISFHGGITPRALPRSEPAPVSVHLEGRIRAPAARRPPVLRKIRIALNRGGILSSRGLSVCRQGQLDAATPAGALAACRDARVGQGSIVARSAFTGQPTSTLHAAILLFNGVEGGRPAIFAHVFQAKPVPVTRVIVFRIRHQDGTFGTVITGQIPLALNRNGHLTSIFMQLERRYVFHGRPRSYLSASCATPAGVNVASFPFAQASMTFEDGRTLSSTLTRSCRVSR